MIEENQKSEAQPDYQSVQPPQQIIHQHRERSGIWALIGVVAGFMLPTIACGMLTLITFIGLSIAGSGASGAAPTSTGFGDAVAIVQVKGVIASGDETDIGTGAISGVVIADLEAAAADPSVKAIVLRIDSPGGGVTGAAQIYEALLEIDKPIVVSMAATAASGGYYISAPTDYIFARPDTLTGSIGVISTFINAEEFLDDLGIEVSVIATGENKDFGSLWSDLTPEQEEIWRTITDELYNDFIQVIVDGRNMSESTVRELADGRIFSGSQALENGLVDELGSLDEAIEKAADLGGISGDPRIVEYERIPSFQELLLGFSANLNRTQSDEINQLIQEFTTPVMEYRYIGPQ